MTCNSPEGHSICGKKILFFAPAFFGYEAKIKTKLQQMGAQVDAYDVRSVNGAFDRALLKLSPAFFKKKTQQYYDRILQINHDKDYDFVLIVKCDMTTEKILGQYRQAFPRAKFILYLWDSVNNIPGISSKFKHFDRIMSFDKQDILKYPFMMFRPLFYADEFQMDSKAYDQYDYDICFCGTIHSDRYAIINKVIQICRKQNLRYYTFCYLQSRFIYLFYKLTKKEFRSTHKSEFSFEPLSSREISSIIDKSKVIVDIQHPKQTGLTMRTIEMVGMNKKLITTNAEIIHYDFYDPVNILIIDRKNVQIPDSFINSQYQKLDTDIYDKYSIEHWINDIFKS